MRKPTQLSRTELVPAASFENPVATVSAVLYIQVGTILALYLSQKYYDGILRNEAESQIDSSQNADNATITSDSANRDS